MCSEFDAAAFTLSKKLNEYTRKNQARGGWLVSAPEKSKEKLMTCSRENSFILHIQNILAHLVYSVRLSTRTTTLNSTKVIYCTSIPFC